MFPCCWVCLPSCSRGSQAMGCRSPLSQSKATTASHLLMEPEGWNAGICREWKPISATTSQLDWDGLAFLSGSPESDTSIDIQPVKESTDPLVQLHHEWPLGVIPSKLSEGGTLSLLYNCSCSSHIECFKAVGWRTTVKCSVLALEWVRKSRQHVKATCIDLATERVWIPIKFSSKGS